MRVADYVVDFINKAGIETVYMVSGGGMIFLADALACNSTIKIICNHHEQASAMAAVAHAKYKGLGCALVTTGCGGTNTITGLLHAWQDSTPCLFISGQCKRNETVRNSGLLLRQLGVQEADIVELVKPITKYAVMINEGREIRFHLEKALHEAISGRPGPVWLDIPLDVQTMIINPEELLGYEADDKREEKPSLDSLANALSQAIRPLIIAGHGVRLSNTISAFESFVHKYRLPVVCSRMGLDVMPTTDELYIGRIGNKGTRAANFAVQNADLLLVLGSRLSISSTGYSYDKFAPYASVYVVDIDDIEHKKGTVSIDSFIHCDLKDFFRCFPDLSYLTPDSWLNKCLEWKNTFPIYLENTNKNTKGVDLYYFINTLSQCLLDDDTIVTDAGSAAFAPAQGIILNSPNQRYITSGGQAEMGFTLPGAIGVSIASGKRTIGITGDGSLQMNIQELQTLVHYQIPVKLFVWNNQGYLSIRATQKNLCNGRYIGSDNAGGVSFPNLQKIAAAYGIQYIKIETPEQLKSCMQTALDYDGPFICEVICNPDQEIVPVVSSMILEDGTITSPPIDDMYPFLTREEYAAQCIARK